MVTAGNVAIFNSISDYLIARIPEISYLLSSVLMIFASDYVMEHYFLRRLKKMDIVSRTFVFLLYGLLALPALTMLGALVLRVVALYPLQDWIIVVLLVSFFFIAILLSIRYNMKFRLRAR